MEGEQIAKNNEGLKFIGFIWDMKWGLLILVGEEI